MKEKRIQFNKTNILNAAESLFAGKGIVQTTMDDIAKAADYSKSTIYVYFKSKEEIYNTIILTHMTQMEEAIRKCIERAENSESCYFDFCGHLVQFYEHYPMYFQGMMGKISIDQKEMEESEVLRQIYDVGEKLNDDMKLLFEMGRKEGYLRDDINAIPTGLAFLASLSGIITLAYEKEAYISMRTGMSRTDYLQYGFEMLLASIRR